MVEPQKYVKEINCPIAKSTPPMKMSTMPKGIFGNTDRVMIVANMAMEHL
jgi:hypothetical protein